MADVVEGDQPVATGLTRQFVDPTEFYGPIPVTSGDNTAVVTDLTLVSDKKTPFQTSSTGSETRDNFTLAGDERGRYKLTEQDGTERTFPRSGLDTQASRIALINQVNDSPMDATAKARFIADMIRFENRASEQGVSEAEIKETYKQLGRLLRTNNDGSSAFPPNIQTALAQQLIRQFADPTLIRQGRADTCNVSAGVETRLAFSNPSTLANTVAEIAKRGEFSTSSGTVKIPGIEDIINSFAHTGNPPQASERSFASQLFQIAAINALLQSRGVTDSYYGVRPKEQAALIGESDLDRRLRETEERDNPPPAFIDGIYAHGQNGRISDNPEFHLGTIMQANALFQANRPGTFLASNDYLAHIRRTEPNMALPPWHVPITENQVNQFQTEEQLHERLAAAKGTNAFPITIVTPGHVSNIIDYNPATQEVTIFDQGQRNAIRRMKVPELYFFMATSMR